MKILIVGFLSILLVEADASTSISGRPAKSYYLEIVPGESKTLLFETENAKFHCEDRLDVKTFESSKMLSSVDTGKPVSVKVMNIYVGKILAGCLKKGEGKKLTAEYRTTKSKTMSHLYITTDADVGINF